MDIHRNKRFAQAASLSLKQLSYLLTVSKTLNFTRAAELCFVTQSTLSGGLAELERTLGVKLVERDRQRVLLTPIGHEVAQWATTMLSASDHVLGLAQQANDPTGGHLHLGIIPTIAPFWIGQVLSRCAAAFPNLHVSVRESQTHTLLEAIHNGELDTAIVATPIAVGKLAVCSLFQEPLCLVAHETDALITQPQVFIDHIDPNRLLLLEQGHCLREHTLLACHAEKTDPHTPGIEISNLSTMVQLVQAGLGYGLLPHMALKAGLLNGTQVKPVALAGPQPTRTIALVTRPSHPKLGFLHQQFAGVLT